MTTVPVATSRNIYIYGLLLAAAILIDGCRFGSDSSCTYSCHCAHGGACIATTGKCPDGCDDGNRNNTWWSGAWSGPGCQFGNVAFNKRTYSNTNITLAGRDSSLAVDGNTDPTYVIGGNPTDSCAYVRVDEDIGETAYWAVDLGGTYVIYSLTLYGRSGRQSNHWKGKYISVGNGERYEECGDFPNQDIGLLESNVTCRRPIIGRKVTIKVRDVSDNNCKKKCEGNRIRLILCEIMIFGYAYEDCDGGKFGPGCLRNCNCRSDCDVISGNCSGTCEDGWLEHDCQMPCGNGFWGRGCRNSCYCKDENEKCYHVTGSCARSGCAERRVGIGCDAVLPSLHVLPNISFVDDNWMELKLEFEAWTESVGVGDTPTSYKIQIEESGKWIDLSPVSAPNSVSMVHKLPSGVEPGNTYLVRIIPQLKHEGHDHDGEGVNTNLTLPAQPITVPKSSSDTLVTVLALLVVVTVCLIGILAVILWLQMRNVVPEAGIKGRDKRRRTSGASGGSKIGTETHMSESTVGNNHSNASEIARERLAYNQTVESPLTRQEALDDTGEFEVMVDPPSREVMDTHGDEGNIYDNEGNIYGNEVRLCRPVKVQNLANHIQDMKNQSYAFKHDFNQIPYGPTAEWKTGSLSVNKPKNRFNNILAYDHSRVELNVTFKNRDEGYINANFMPSYKDTRGYIASQGPRSNTVVDMWRMIWQYNINRVVMVTRTQEENKLKCAVYWPEESDIQEFGSYKVSLLKTTTFADYIFRSLSVKHKGESRFVTQYQFVGWPDHGIPLVATSLLEFRRKVRSEDRFAKGPLLVHCSAGVGRTGTFLALDYLLDQAKAEGEVDIFKFTSLMRTYRINMIQNLDQYIFVHNALLQGLMSENTTIPCARMEEIFPTLLQTDPVTQQSPLEKQFEVLESMKPPKPKNVPSGLRPENKSKNRDKNIIPLDNNRPFLFPRGKGSTVNYINAAFINGYSQQRPFIVTQMPLPDTMGDFWQMVYDQQCSAIVLLHDLDLPTEDDKPCPQYWPNEMGENMGFDTLEVELTTVETIQGGLTMREFRIHSSKRDEKPLDVIQFHLTGWPEDAATPTCPGKLINLLEVLVQWQQQSKDKTITVQCKTGARHCGIVCAASFLVEKMKVDQEVDAFMAVAQIRLGRPQLIESMEQYLFLHQIAIEYMQRNDAYANFK